MTKLKIITVMGSVLFCIYVISFIISPMTASQMDTQNEIIYKPISGEITRENEASLKEMDQIITLSMQILGKESEGLRVEVNEESLQLFNKLIIKENISYGEILEKVFPKVAKEFIEGEYLELLYDAPIYSKENEDIKDTTIIVFRKVPDSNSN